VGRDNEENGAASRMVDLQLKARGISNARVLDAMLRVPRRLFVPQGQRSEAYGDFPVSIGHGQTISQPYMVAFMTEALELTGKEKVLEIGTGSGYQTAVLAELSASVYSVERVTSLHSSAGRVLGDMGYTNIRLFLGDGGAGLAEHAPFDRILVTAAAPSIPAALADELSDNGIIVVPVGDYRFSQVLVIGRRVGKRIDTRESIGCRFVPLIGKGGFER
jgi:protein-L-isoaspartate(D-aspartate) O-methyltransferase